MQLVRKVEYYYRYTSNHPKKDAILKFGSSQISLNLIMFMNNIIIIYDFK